MASSKKSYYAPMHTAEHILNATMVKMFSCERSVNCHIERKKSKCDFLLTSAPTQTQILEIEKRINYIITQDLPVTHNYIDYDEAKKKFKLRVEKSDNPQIRITSIGSYDRCPCIGEHVVSTSSIGIFTISSTTYENGIFRIRYKLQ